MKALRTSASLLVVLILQVGSHDLVSATFFDHSDAELYDTVTLRDVTPTSHRSRRSVGGMPSHLHFDFDTGSQTVSLRLRRSAQMTNVPVFTIGDSEKLEEAHLPKMTDTAVYRDIHRGAAIVAKKAHGVGREFSLQGLLHVDNRPYTISPREKFKAAGRGVMEHVLHVVQNDDSYGTDYVEPGADDETDYNTYQGYRPNRLYNRGGVGAYRRLRRYKRDDSMPVFKIENLHKEKKDNPRVRHNIKVNIFCDYGCYQKFYERHGHNRKRALEEARLYFAYLSESLDVRFRTISTLKPGVMLTVTPASIISATTPKGAIFSEESRVKGSTEGVNGNQLLPSFRKWVKNNKLPKAATTILQTGYNMMTKGDPDRSGQLGLGYRGGACGRSNVVVVEEKFHGITGMITAHELGHNLGSQHDGSYASKKTECTGDKDRYVMSTYIGVPRGSSKPWTFSKCSADRIVEFITEEHPECFHDDYERRVPNNGGQVYDADDQCSITFGKGSYFCRGRQLEAVGFEDMCTKMYCSVTPGVDNSCTPIVPIEYTSCGHRKWCVRGQCVHDARAPPKVQDSCPQGDDPTYGCSQRSCRNGMERSVFCCETCLSRRPISERLPQRNPNSVGRTRPLAPATTTPVPSRPQPRVCRYSYFYCQICVRSNYAYKFCRV